MNQRNSWWNMTCAASLLTVLFGFLFLTHRCPAQEKLNRDSATHKAMHSIKPSLEGNPLQFHTFRLSPERELWLCCGNNTDPGQGMLLVYDVEGAFQRSISLSFVPTAIDFATSGGVVESVFAAGSGKVAKLSRDGAEIKTIDAPNLENREEALAAMRAEAGEKAEELLTGIKKQAERIANKIAELESAPEDETEEQQSRRQRRLKVLLQQANQIQLTIDSVSSGEAAVSEKSLGRLEYATSLAVSEQFVFVSLPVVTGYGYDVWRLDHELSQPKKVLERGRGCCGQFDIHTDGKQLVVAENCNFQVAYYDSDGQPVKSFGERLTEDTDGFGSCCNPMNVCCQGDEVLTAESSIGHIRRFTSDGKLLAYIGTAPIGGGCKHVALAHDRISDRYFMFNQDRKCISVLIPKSEAVEESEDEQASRTAMEGLGKQLLGSWQVVSSDENPDSANEMKKFLSQRYGSVTFEENGQLEAPGLSQNLSPNAQLLELLTKLTGSDEAAKLLFQPVHQPRWTAIEQQDQTLRIGLIEDGATNFIGAIQFSDPNSITVGFSLSSAETVAELNFHRSND
jgi:hypothetical protein